MDSIDMAKYIAAEGAEVASRWFREKRPFDARSKADGSLVTTADLDVEHRIITKIRELDPEAAIVSEENGAWGSGRRIWYIDPIDGTENFARGIPIWGVLVACVEEGQTTASAVCAPELNQLWSAKVGEGSWSGNKQLLASSKFDLATANITLGGWHEARSPLEEAVLASLGSKARVAWGYGNFWGHMLVAGGQLDAAVSLDTKIWDVLAPSLIAREAGAIAAPLWTSDGSTSLVTGGPEVMKDIQAVVSHQARAFVRRDLTAR